MRIYFICGWLLIWVARLLGSSNDPTRILFILNMTPKTCERGFPSYVNSIIKQTARNQMHSEIFVASDFVTCLVAPSLNVSGVVTIDTSAVISRRTMEVKELANKMLRKDPIHDAKSAAIVRYFLVEDILRKYLWSDVFYLEPETILFLQLSEIRGQWGQLHSLAIFPPKESFDSTPVLFVGDVSSLQFMNDFLLQILRDADTFDQVYNRAVEIVHSAAAISNLSSNRSFHRLPSSSERSRLRRSRIPSLAAQSPVFLAPWPPSHIFKILQNNVTDRENSSSTAASLFEDNLWLRYASWLRDFGGGCCQLDSPFLSDVERAGLKVESLGDASMLSYYRFRFPNRLALLSVLPTNVSQSRRPNLDYASSLRADERFEHNSSGTDNNRTYDHFLWDNGLWTQAVILLSHHNHTNYTGPSTTINRVGNTAGSISSFRNTMQKRKAAQDANCHLVVACNNVRNQHHRHTPANTCHPAFFIYCYSRPQLANRTALAEYLSTARNQSMLRHVSKIMAPISTNRHIENRNVYELTKPVFLARYPLVNLQVTSLSPHRIQRASSSSVSLTVTRHHDHNNYHQRHHKLQQRQSWQHEQFWTLAMESLDSRLTHHPCDCNLAEDVILDSPVILLPALPKMQRAIKTVANESSRS